MQVPREEAERLNAELNDPKTLRAYQERYDSYRSGAVARLLGNFLVGAGNLIYGKEPSYLKFRAIEVIARVPYHSWASAAFTLLTLHYANEKIAMRLSQFAWFSELAQDNETMHVVVISQLARAEGAHSFMRGTLIPLLFAFLYFWVVYWLYLIRPRAALELNYLFEDHAFRQYDRFLEVKGAELKRKMILSDYLEWYGRHPRSQYEFFRSVRNDEIVHRNDSARRAEGLMERARA